MSNYHKINREHISAIQDIVGIDNIRSDTAIAVEYTHDAGTKNDKPRYPELVVLPQSSSEIAAIMKLANHYGIPVTPRGGGSGLAGAAVPLYGGILLDLQRMNKILHLDVTAQYMVVEPAVRTLDIQETASRSGLLYAGDPCSNDNCVIAGNIATNAGGNRAVKYGVTADQIYELEVVTPQGQIVTLGGRLKKNATGYNLLRLIIGSEGTLGIITKATLKLQKLAPFMPNFLVVLPDLQTTVSLVKDLTDDDVIDPLSLELIDKNTAIEIERYQGKQVFGNPAGDCLLVQWQAQSDEEFVNKQQRLQDLVAKHSFLSLNEVDGNIIWPVRRTWGKAVEQDHPISASEDLVVPVDLIGDFIEKLTQLTQDWQFSFRIAGHAGDGNMHVRLIPDQLSFTEWEIRLPKFRQVLYAATYRLGGRLSGEHGIGLKRKDFLRTLADPNELALMQSIKQAFDPQHILNPGKIFDLDYDGTH
jgi:glycolate oxidase